LARSGGCETGSEAICVRSHNEHSKQAVARDFEAGLCKQLG